MDARIRVQVREGKPYLVVEYGADGYDSLQQKFEELGLKKRTTSNGFGRGMEVQYYKSTGNELLSTLQNSESLGEMRGNLVDDVNSSVVFNGNNFNIAVFRVVPSGSSVEFPLSSYLTVAQLRQVKAVFGEVLGTLLSIVPSLEIEVETEGVAPARPRSRRRRAATTSSLEV